MRKAFFMLCCALAGTWVFAQDQVLLQDELIPATDTVWVFTPRTYDNEKAYPVVYMLHGYSSDYKQWHQIMDAQNYADTYEMIIVCPDGFYNSWYFDSPKKENSQYASFFFEVLLEQIESKYAIDPANRFITGLSMGGHGAFHLFLQRPELFRSAGSTSGVMDLRGSAGLFELHEHLGDFKENEVTWLQMSAVGNVDEISSIGKELIFDCGTEDPFFKWNMDFYQMTMDQNVPITFISQPGKHDWDYWEKSIRAHFEFFKTKVE
jgi:S-formylglutathione hydrolase FrmB